MMIGVCRYRASLLFCFFVGMGVTLTSTAEQLCLQGLSLALDSFLEIGILKSP